MATSDDDFRTWLIQRLDELDLTPRRLSILSGVSPGYFSMYLADTLGTPPPRVLRAGEEQRIGRIEQIT